MKLTLNLEKKMNKVIRFAVAFVAGFVLVALASSAFASSDSVRVLKVKDVYKTQTIVNQKPVQTCRNVDVPIYKQTQGGDDLGAFLGGAIIGGVIGNQIGDSKGNGALGAIIGGAIANEKQKKQGTTTIVGYKRERVCETTYQQETQQVRTYKHSYIEFMYKGDQYHLEFIKR